MNKPLQRFVSTKPMAWFFLNVFPHIDRPLLRLPPRHVSRMGEVVDLSGARTPTDAVSRGR